MSLEVCRAKARSLVAQLGLEGPPVDVEAVAASLGLSVRLVSRLPRFEGQFLQEQSVIEVNRNHHLHKRRFTIAHEIGHVVLGHNPVVSVFNDRSRTDPSRRNEQQANAFAAELLMPSAWVREHWKGLNTIPAIAALFQVSDEAMFRTLEALDLLGLEPRIQGRRPESS